MKFMKREWPWLLGIFVLVFVVWGLRYDKLSPANWGQPPSYGGDTAINIAVLKSAAEGENIPFLHKTISRLGAPFAANWDDFPLTEEIYFFALGVVGKAIGLFQACNLAVLLSHISIGLVFYGCCRFLRYRREWSFLGALLFAFAYFQIFREFAHLSVALSYIVPLMILACWLVAGSRHLRWRSKESWLCLATALLAGLGNPYNLNMFLQLIGLAVLAQWLVFRRKANWQIGLACIGLALAGFFASNMDTLTFQWQHGKNSEAMFRSYFQCELYSLKPMELFIPPPEHNVGALAAIGQRYGASAYLKGEVYSAYLGIVGIVAFFWMLAVSLRLVLRRARQRFPAHALQSGWVLAYASVGGLNCLMALGGLVLFRSSNRYSIFISALLMLFLAGQLSRLTRRWTSGARWALMVGLLLVGLADQVPAKNRSGLEPRDLAKMSASDVAFGAAMEAKLPPGTMVFQLPVMDFPEAGGVLGAEQDEHLRPYCVTKTLRFSFGNVKGRPRDSWQREVEKLPAVQMAEALEKYGFGAIYIARKGFQDNAESLLKEWAASGRAVVAEDEAKEHICVALKPAAAPVLPDTAGLATMNFKAGWSVTERTPAGPRRWTVGNAQAFFFNDAGNGAAIAMKCQIGSPNPRLVLIQVNGKEVWRANLSAGQMAPVDLIVDAKRGNNELLFLTDTPPVQASPGSGTMIAFAVVDLKIGKKN